MAWIETIAPDAAEGSLGELYAAIARARGGVAAVHVAQSLHPRALRAHLELYKAVVLGAGALPRRTREAIAVVVSATNECRYCAQHHGAAMRQLGEAEDVVGALVAGAAPRLPDREIALLDWARHATREPARARRGDLDALRAYGWTDAAILEAVLVVAYFSFVNRIVLLLGVDLEDGYEATCR